MLARSFLIELSSKLLVNRLGVKARSSSILGRIRPLILDLLALEWRNFHTFELEYLWNQLVNLGQILCVASLGWGKGCLRFCGRFDQNSGFRGNKKPPMTYNGENDVSIFSRLFFIRSFLYLQVTRTCIKSRMSSNFGQIGPLNTELAARHLFPIINQYGIFVAMETRVLIQSVPKPYAAFSLIPVMLHIKLIKIGQLASELFKFESLDDDGPLVYYKLTLWAFGSGELKIARVNNSLEISFLLEKIFFFRQLFTTS